MFKQKLLISFNFYKPPDCKTYDITNYITIYSYFDAITPKVMKLNLWYWVDIF